MSTLIRRRASDLLVVVGAVMVLASILVLVWRAQHEATDAARAATYNKRLLDSRTPIIGQVPALRTEVGRLHAAERRHALADEQKTRELQHVIVEQRREIALLKHGRQ